MSENKDLYPPYSRVRLDHPCTGIPRAGFSSPPQNSVSAAAATAQQQKIPVGVDPNCWILVAFTAVGPQSGIASSAKKQCELELRTF
jgi:hypothetical protein